MALDPRIALATTPINIQMPDFGRTMLQAAQLQQAMQQRQAHEIAMQGLLREREREKALQAYVTRQMGQGQAATLSQLVPEVQPGTPLSLLSPGERPAMYGPDQAPWAGGKAMSPAAVQRTYGALPETTYRRAEMATPAPGVQTQAVTEVAPGRQQQATTVTSTQGPQRLTENLDWREMYKLDPKKGMQTFAALRQMEQGDAAAEMKLLTSSAGILDELLGIVHDQSSLDKARAGLMRIPGIGPEMAGLLPEVFDEAQLTKLRQQLVPMKQQMARQRAGLEIVPGVDAQGKPVAMQATDTGDLRPFTLPSGVTYQPKSIAINTPQAQTLVNPYTGQPVAQFPKDNRTPALEKAAGTQLGTVQGQRPEKAKEAYALLETVEQKQQIATQKIDEAMALINTSTLPTTGIVGSWIKSVYQPGTDLAVILENLGSIVGFDELRSLKDAGTTLGQVTSPEHTYLQSQIASLKQAQDKPQLLKALGNIKQYMAERATIRRDAYGRDFSQTLTPPVERSPYGNLKPEDLTPAQRREELQWLKQRYQGGQ